MKRLLIALLAVLLVLSLAACGGKDEPEAPSASPLPSDGEGDPMPLLPRPDPNAGPKDFSSETAPRFDPTEPVSEPPVSEPPEKTPPKEEPKIIDGPDGKKYLNNRISVKFTGTVTAGQAVAFADGFKGTLDSETPADGVWKIDLDDPLSYDDLLITAFRMKADPTVLDAWLDPISQFDDGTPAPSPGSSSQSETPPAVVSSQGNILIYDKSPVIPVADPYGGVSADGSRG